MRNWIDTDMHNLITDVAGLSVGHATDLHLGSGVSVVVFDQPAVASGLALGGAPGSREMALLDPANTVERVDAFVLSGGSAFGLDAAGGVQAGLREDGRGLPLGSFTIPIVPQAILMDLMNGGDKDWGRFSPYRQLGYDAYRAATAAPFPLGTTGAGTGATTATLKGGLGSASAVSSTGLSIAALVAVNAMGTATVADGPHFWAAPFERSAEFGGRGVAPHDPEKVLELRIKGQRTTATTIGTIATDASLTKAQAHRIAVSGHDGFARAIYPAHLPYDGDTVFAAATGHRPAPNDPAFAELCMLAANVMARAIARGVYEATALPHAHAQKSWKDIFG